MRRFDVTLIFENDNAILRVRKRQKLRRMIEREKKKNLKKENNIEEEKEKCWGENI